MTDRADGRRGIPTPMVWALVMRAAYDRREPPIVEAIVEFGPHEYPILVSGALDSGFALAAGQPPPTSAAVQVRGHRITQLVLVGGREVWELGSPVEVAPTWLSAAEERGRITLVVVPSDTWPANLAELTPDVRDHVFMDSLEHVYEAGQVLHGFVRLIEEETDHRLPD